MLRAADAAELLEAGAHILADFEDRTLLNGVSEIVESDTDPATPLVRRYRRPGLLRVASSGALFATMLAAGARLVELSTATTAGALLGYLTVAVLAAGSLIWALVDWDTFYLDTPSFWPFTIVAWLGAIGTAALESEISRPLAGLAICAGGAVVFVGANLAYLLLRGVNGMGFGDTLILFATAGVPAALTGSWQLGYMAIIGSMLLGIVGWLLLRLAGRVTRESRFAFGPYLAIGWALAAAAWSM
jgi:leader peptidase (prepilin peptidase)/N-methyltransferase